MSGAAAWVAPVDETDRGNVLGAAVVAAQRDGRALAAVVDGPERLEEAIAAGREAGLLVIPALDQVLPDMAQAAALVERARAEGWRVLLLSLGADSAAASGDIPRLLLRRLTGMEAPERVWEVPPAELRHRVGAGGGQAFIRSGLLHVECFEESLAAVGVRLADGRDLLEWGAGCGRMTVHFADRAPGARVTVADTDGEAIAWVAEHVPLHATATLPILPPSELPSDAYDLVVGHSVLSHLDVRAQDLWLAELARVTRPGGHVAVSFNGPAALDWHLEHPLVDVPRSVADAVAHDGVAIWTGDGWEDEFYDGYHTTFHEHAYVRAHWSRWFDVLTIDEAAAWPTQDIAVLRAREAPA